MKFELLVNVHRRPNMLDDNLEYVLHMGQRVLRQIFVEERVDGLVRHVEFWFPERWLNIIQERSLYERLERFCPNLERVVINTQSVYIIQCTSAENIRIISSSKKQDYTAKHLELPQECAQGVTSFDVCLVPDFSTIQTFSSNTKL